MGYMKVVCDGPGVHKTIENLLCLSIGNRIAPDTMWYDWSPEDNEFVIMGITAKQAGKLMNYIYEKSPDYIQRRLRFKLVGYSDDSFRKPRDSWEALAFMLQAFPKRRKFEDETR